LPPIVTGAYPEPPPGDPPLHRSIFEATYGDGSIVCKLVENFRMNDVLTGHVAALIYGSDYRCFDDDVASRRLRLRPRRRRAPGLSPLVQACIAPEFPLVLVVLEGVRAPTENEVEARIVADIAVALREEMSVDDGEPYADDAAFFRRGLFIVSPHHDQIRSI